MGTFLGDPHNEDDRILGTYCENEKIIGASIRE